MQRRTFSKYSFDLYFFVLSDPDDQADRTASFPADGRKRTKIKMVVYISGDRLFKHRLLFSCFDHRSIECVYVFLCRSCFGDLRDVSSVYDRKHHTSETLEEKQEVLL